MKNALKTFNKDLIFALVILAVVICSVISKDDILSLFIGTFGIIYTVLIGRGAVIAYLFGITGTLCGALLSYKLGLWGNFSLHLFYYFPMMILGFFNWRTHIDKEKKEVIKERLKKKELIFYILMCILGIIAVYLLFIKIGDKSPLLDSSITVLSLFGMFLTVKRYIEQWIVWIIVDFLLIFMWFFVVQNGGQTVAVLISRVIYLLLGIYFYIKWRKDFVQN